MINILTDISLSDAEFRQHLYAGDVLAYSPRPSLSRLRQHACDMIHEVLPDAQHAQFRMPVEEYVKIVADLKPRFIHHAQTKMLLQAVLAEFGCDMERTYFDVPRLRMVTSGGYLTTGVGYAHLPHRDTWYAAPLQQINWWIPLYDICPENTIAFHPHYWDNAINNGSDNFNYYQWNELRKSVHQHVRSDDRFQPKAEEPLDRLEPSIRIVVPRDGAIVFSGAQLHSTVPNTSGLTRYSIDFRTINVDDVVNQRGAPNIDSKPQGTSLRDFMHARTLERLPQEIIQSVEPEQPVGGTLIFAPSEMGNKATA